MLRVGQALALGLAGVLGAGASASASASAQPALSPAQVYVGFYDSSTEYPPGPTTYNAPGIYYVNYQIGDASLYPSAAPAVFSSAMNQSGANAPYTVETAITYYYSIDGASDALAPVKITFNAATTANGASAWGDAFIQTQVYDLYGTALPQTQDVCSASGAYSCTTEPLWTGLSQISGGTFTGYVPTNTPMSIMIDAISASRDGPGSAMVDPQISSLDPAYTLQLSPGVSNTIEAFTAPAPSVPEPATWAMLILGIAILGIAARRRSGSAALAA